MILIACDGMLPCQPHAKGGLHVTSPGSIALRIMSFVLPTLITTGCWHTEPSLKPPPRPEVLAVPPSEDSRFSSPVEYPKGTLNQDILPKDPNAKKEPNDARFGTGMGPGMGGPGGGY
jgi:hypothetical protein